MRNTSIRLAFIVLALASAVNMAIAHGGGGGGQSGATPVVNNPYTDPGQNCGLNGQLCIEPRQDFVPRLRRFR